MSRLISLSPFSLLSRLSNQYNQRLALLPVALVTWLLLALLPMPGATIAHAATLYVDQNATGANNGASWADAYTDLQNALGIAAGGDQVRVATGVYTPGAARGDSFNIPPGVTLYGGFPTGGGSLDRRDWQAHATVLSGDIDNNDTTDVNGIVTDSSHINGANAYHVVMMDGTGGTNITASTRLDGFTITGGQANGGASPDDQGGGLYCNGSGGGSECSPTLVNLTFSGNMASNSGGAIYNDGSRGSGSLDPGFSSPTLTNVTFKGNTAADGGAIYNWGQYGFSSPILVDVTFLGNSASNGGGAIYNYGVLGRASPTLADVIFIGNTAGGKGGAMHNNGHDGRSSPALTNALFYNNSAGYGGGAIYNDGSRESGSWDPGSSSPTLTNVTFSGNTSGLGGAIFNVGDFQEPTASSPTLTNVVLWGNTATNGGAQIYDSYAAPWVDFSVVQGGCSFGVVSSGACGANVLTDDPLFVDATTGDLRLQSGSPAIDVGYNAILAGVATDLNGLVRVQNGTVDMGAYETPLTSCPAGGVVYVDRDAIQPADGASWATAYRSLQDAFVVEEACDVWVAAGVYTPGTARSDTFNVPPWLSLYGGFAGDETTLAERDWTANRTVLSGDIDRNDTTDAQGVVIGTAHIHGANAYHVVTLDGTGGTPITASTRLDGFTITGGQANGAASPDDRGGGLFCNGSDSGSECSPTLTNLTFSGNTATYGGALFNEGGNNGLSSPTLTEVAFRNNSAATHGGAIYNAGGYGGDSSPSLTQVTFSGNAAASDGGALFCYGGDAGQCNPTLTSVIFSDNTANLGGAMYNDGSNTGDSSPTLVNAVFRSNTAQKAGAMFNHGMGGTSNPTLTNVTFWGNTTADEGAVLYNSGLNGVSNPLLTNVILWGNVANGATGTQILDEFATTTVNHSLVQGGWIGNGTGNISTDPRFFDAANGDLRLGSGSPAIDAGNNTAVPAGVTSDLAGAPRFHDDTATPDTGQGTAPLVDLGAYEHQNVDCTSVPSVLYVDQSLTEVGSGASWADAYTSLQAALLTAHDCADVAEIWVAAGVYTPGAAREDRFAIPPGVAVYGGFAGGETARSERDWAANPAILSGDIGGDDTTDADGVVIDPAHIAGTNAYHIVVMDGTEGTPITSTTILDGFTLTGGQADGSTTPDDRGAGLFCNGYGSGSECSPTLTNLIFSGNTAAFGAALFNEGSDGGASSPMLTHALFWNNRATSNGGAIYDAGANGGDSSPTLTHVTFSGNQAWDSGGAIFSYGEGGSSNPTLTNSILWGNNAAFSRQIHDNNATTSVAYSLVEGGWSGAGNLDADPLFVDAANGDLRLGSGSPAIDAGDNGAVPAGITGDLAAAPRFHDDLLRPDTGVGTPPLVDLGAYERQNTSCALVSDVVYVDQSATGAGAGTHWADAYTDLQTALHAARDCANVSEIWVAEGVYIPGTTPSDSFDIPPGVAVYGGFSGNESARSERDWAANRTVLSGDLGDDDTTDADGVVTDPANIAGANAYHVVTLDGTVGTSITATTRLDGLTITGGQANGAAWPNDRGGGVFCNGLGVGNECSPTLINLIFSGNTAGFGGAIFNEGSDGGISSPTLTQVAFQSNNATTHGGALYNSGANGGASSPTLTNVTFSGNTAGSNGGAIYSYGVGGSSTPTLTNSILWGNSAITGAQILDDSATTSVAYSLVEGGWGGVGNINADPRFVDAANGDLRLQGESPAIDAGDNGAVPSGVTTDLAGAPRFYDDILVPDTGVGTPPLADLGAYERQTNSCSHASSVVHVDQDATGGQTGASWADAYTDLQAALLAARGCSSVEEVWVAAGVYTPGTARSDSYDIPPGVAIYGGFAGGETARSERDWVANATVLSGDIGGDDTTDADGVVLDPANINGGNAYHVVTLDGTGEVPVTGSTLVDGFTITGGHADGDSALRQDRGAGLFCTGAGSENECSPALINLTFSGNAADFGGAIFNDGSDFGVSSPALTRVTFRNNHAAIHGGAIYSTGGNVGDSRSTLNQVAFTGNTAVVDGGAVYWYGGMAGNCKPTLTNVIFSANSADQHGGAMYSNGDTNSGTSSPTLINVTLWGNTATDGAALYNSAIDGFSRPTLTNVILWGNTATGGTGAQIFNENAWPTINYSLIQGGATETGNIDADPLFVDAAAGDLRLQSGSPAIDAGDTSAVSGISTDLDGKARVENGVVDMGAYETARAICPAGGIVYVDQDAAATADGASWATAYRSLQDALNVVDSCDVWVAAGVYTPGSNRDDHFAIPGWLSLYGGFAGGETSLSERDWVVNPTVLSGDIGGDDTTDTDGVVADPSHINGSNAYHVVIMEGMGSAPITETVHFDGFTITGGQANGSTAPDDRGGGLFCNGAGIGSGCDPTLSNLVFSGNTAGLGGALFNEGTDYGSGSPTLNQVLFQNNRATIHGGAIYNNGANFGASAPALTNVLFRNNSAVTNGGAMYNMGANNGDSSPTLTNVTFSDNTAGDSGGAIYSDGLNGISTPALTNAILWGNTATTGPQIHVNSAMTAFAYSLVQGGCPAGATCDANLIDADPLFVDAANGDLRLQPNSPAIDAGDNAAVPSGITIDLAGAPRFHDDVGIPDSGAGSPPLVDLGAHERQSTSCVNVSSVVYVDRDATGAASGASWDDAYTDLQTALAAAGDCADTVEVWVAAGVYTPGTARSDSYNIPPGVAVYGGFAGNETALSDRDWATHRTVLSGDIGGDDTTDADGVVIDPADINGANAYHVVVMDGAAGTPITVSTVLDGFTLTGGQADGDGGLLQDGGGGLLCNGTGSGSECSPTLTNLTFSGNMAHNGGAMYNTGASGGASNPTLTDIMFSGNTASYLGGGLYCSGWEQGQCSPTLDRVTFRDNSADRGGAMFNDGSWGASSPTLINVVFHNNRATDKGGAMHNMGADDGDSSPTLTNVTFSANSADSGGAIFSDGGSFGHSSPILTNSILWGNTATTGPQILVNDAMTSVAYSLVQGGCPVGVGCDANLITVAPLFVDPASGDLRLQRGSPAVDAGDNTALPNGVIADLAGAPRFHEDFLAPDTGAGAPPLVDLGAHEWQGDSCVGVPSRVYVNASASGLGIGTTWADAYTDLQSAFAVVRDCGNVTEIWVASGVYTPGTARSDHFAIPPGVAVYGGFAGNESALSERDWATHRTVLSGDIDNNDITDADEVVTDPADINGANAYHVVVMDGAAGTPVTGATVLDGFTLTGGQADGDSGLLQDRGGGLFCNGYGSGSECSPSLVNLTFSGNAAAGDGGGLYCSGEGGQCNPTAVSVIFSGNTANFGAAIYNNGRNSGDSSPALTQVVFLNNEATIHGGAMYNSGADGGASSPTLTNVTFSRNMAGGDGGALYNYGAGGASNPTLTNSILWGNSATNGSQILDNGSTTSAAYSLVQGGWPGTGNLNADPLFVDAASGDLRLQGGSPAIDAGDNGALPSDITADLGGAPRFHDDIGIADTGVGTPPLVDLGAHERQSASCSNVSGVVYVDQKATGGNSGTDWTDAYTDLQTALYATRLCADVTEIWVASGVYTPGEARTDRFDIPPGVALYGGFAGNETARTERDWATHRTVLSGDIDNNDTIDADGVVIDPADIDGANAYHVVVMDGTAGTPITGSTVLDGFTLTGGQADGATSPDDRGAGLFCNGLGNGSECSPTLTNLTFSGNKASFGGALFNEGGELGISSPSLTQIVFQNNGATNNGGAVYNAGANNGQSSPAFINVTFSGNTASAGGAIYSYGLNGASTPTLTNSILWGNTAPIGAQIVDDNATTSAAYSLVQGGWPGTGNLNADPLFVDAANGDLRLSAFSPAIDAGDNGALPSDITADLGGAPRFHDDIGIPDTGEGAPPLVDLGAYEWQSNSCAGVPNRIYVDSSASGPGDGASWTDAYTDLQAALSDARKCVTVTEVWVAAGIYTPGEARTDHFDIPPGVALYGGFAGNEATRSERDWATYRTVLSGDIDNNDTTDADEVVTDSADIDGANAYHVVVMDGTAGNPITGSTVLDGFTITGGQADGDGGLLQDRGAGLFCNGLDNGSECSPTLTNLTFSGNTATYGGALFNEGGAGGISSPTLTQVVFQNNGATKNGGAVYNVGANNGQSSPAFINVTFSGNTASAGGALYSYGLNGASTPTLTNSILWGNTAPIGAQIVDDNATSSAAYSLVQGGWPGTGNLNADPLFVDAASGDLRLQGGSPAIDAGDNGALPSDITADLGGAPRFHDDLLAADRGVGMPPLVDLGAYEWQSDSCSNLSGVVYVDQNATGGNSGTDWIDAYTGLQTALYATRLCADVSEIWVAAGVYTPGAARSDSFNIPPGVALYGGFAGNEAARSERDWAAHRTVLSGDIDNNDTIDADGVVIDAADINGANAYHVVVMDGTAGTPITGSTVLDGFTITGGQASGDGWYLQDRGGGLFCNGYGYSSECSPTLTNLTFSGNAAGFGGALFNDGSELGISSPTLTQVLFQNNGATNNGGAVYNVGDNTGQSSPAFINVTFSGNTAILGGAMYNYGSYGTSSPTLVNVTFSGNTAVEAGGALYNTSWGLYGASTPTLTNSILWGNIAPSGSQIEDNNAATSAAYSLVQGGWPGTGNLNADPLFVDAANGDLRLQGGSPAIDAGDNAAVPSDIATDLGGAPRFHDDIGIADTGVGTPPLVDLGAHERQSSSCSNVSGVVYVDQKATGGNSGTDWTDAYTDLQTALYATRLCADVSEIWVASGVYTPGEARTDRFDIPPGVALYGGFAGNETARSERDWATHRTVLSGDIDNNDTIDADGVVIDPADIDGANAYHVVVMDGTAGTPITGSTVLDGFTLTGGQADGATSPDDRGAGLFCNGLGNGSECSPTLTNLTFSGNTASFGGAIFNEGGELGISSPSLTQIVFQNNGATNNGGAVYNASANNGQSSPAFINVTFSGNTASAGGALFSYGLNGASNPTLTNSILWGNTAATGPQIEDNAAATSAAYSLVQGGWPGTGNLNGDPLFVDAANGDLRLGSGSPAIDAGDNGALPSDTTADLGGAPRFHDDIGIADTGVGTPPLVDLGAHERQSASCSNVAGVVYVDQNATGGETGTDWTDAYTDLQKAITVARDCASVSEIWVASGVYTPGKARTDRFDIPPGVALYGGFAGDEAARSERDWAAHRTVLSGDIDNNDITDADGVVIDAADIDGANAYHVVVLDGTAGTPITSSTILNGFILTGGQADGGASPDDRGGGLLCNGLGGGSECSPTLTNLTFSGNTAVYGGALFNEGGVGGISSPILTQVTFHANRATNNGGAVYNAGGTSGDSSPTLVNVTFSGNAASAGGAIYSYGSAGSSNPTLTNSIVWGNTSTSGLPIEDNAATTSATYSLVQGGWSGEANIDADPLFVDAAIGDLRLQGGSPAIDAGDNSLVSASTDLGGNPRKVDMTFVDDTGNGSAPLVDMGAYEAQYPVGLIFTRPTNGSVTSDYGLDCGTEGSICIEGHAQGDVITLTASPEPGYDFLGWGGDCSGITNPLVINGITSDMTCSTNIALGAQPPVITLPGTPPAVFEDSLNNTITGIAITDLNGDAQTVTLSVSQGTVTLNGTADLSFTAGDGTDDSNLGFSGSLNDVNNALNDLQFTPASDFDGSATLQIQTSDGNGGTDDDTLNITVQDAPEVTAISPVGSSPTNADSVDFTVTFSESVANLDSGDFRLSGTASGSIAAVSATGGTTITVTVNGVSGDGTLGLDLMDDDSVTNSNGVPLGGVGTSGAGDGSFVGAAYTVDNTAPVLGTPDLIATSDTGSSATDDLTADATPTIAFTAESGATIAVDWGDGNGFVAAATGSGAVQQETLGTAYAADGAKTIRVRATDNVGNYTDQTLEVIIDTTAPTVTVDKASGQTDPATASPIHFTVTFSESVIGFTAEDVSLGGTAPGALAASVTGSGDTYNVAVSGMSGSGTVIASLATGVVVDTAGNDNGASTHTDNEVQYNLSELVINELDYDQPATPDNAEFIELYNKGAADIDLSQYELRLVEGDGVTIYQTIDTLTGVVAGGAYHVTCGRSDQVANCDLELAADDLIQDHVAAVALVHKATGAVVDALTYEGSLAANGIRYSEGLNAPADDASEPLVGLGRDGAGNDTNDNSADFALRCVTPGAANTLDASSGCFQLAVNDASISEGDNGTVTLDFRVSLSHPASAAVSVDYASADGSATAAGGDYLGASGTLTFPAGDNTSQTLSISVNGDRIDEGVSEQLWLNLSNASANARIVDGQGTGTIIDDDTAGFTLSKSSATVNESGTTDSVSVTLASQPESDVVLTVTSADIGEVVPSPASLTFTPANWDQAQTLLLTGQDDALVDGDQNTLLTVQVDAANSDDAFDPLADQSISVNVADNDHVLTLSTDGGGAGSVEGGGIHAAGDTVSLTANAELGSQFVGWSEGCAASFEMPAQDLQCTATFEPATHTVTPSAGTGGSIDPGTPQSVNHGETVSFTLAPDADYSIETVTGCGGTRLNDTYTTGEITADCEVSVLFSADAQSTTTVITGHAPAPSRVGEAVTVTYQVTGDQLDPVSTVRIDSSGGESCTGTLAEGQCSLAFTSHGTFSLRASYAGDANNDPSESDPVAHSVDPAADLTLTLSNGQSQSVVGQVVRYTLTINNPGPSHVADAQVAATAPTGLLWSWSCQGQGGANCTAQGVGNIDDTLTLPVDSQVVYTLTATLPADYAETQITATASVSGSGDLIEIDPTNNSATDSDTVIAEANSCYGSDVVVTNTTYVDAKLQGTIVCAADASITAHTEVVGESGSNVTYSAPTIVLGPGFRIEDGATFHAGDYQIPPATVSPRVPRREVTPGPQSRDKEAGRETLAATYRTVEELTATQRQLLAVHAVDLGGLGSAVTDGAGRYLLFATQQSLVAEDANLHSDVYALDLDQQTLHLISRTPQGRAGNGPSGYPALDGHGQRIVFHSQASDLVANGNGESDLYLYEPDYAQITLLTGELDGPAAHPALDGAGEQLLFDHQAGNQPRTLQGIGLLGVGLEAVPQAMGDAHHPALSGDGQSRAWIEEGAGGCQLILHRRDEEPQAYACPQALDVDAVAPLYFEGEVLHWRERDGAVE